MTTDTSAGVNAPEPGPGVGERQPALPTLSTLAAEPGRRGPGLALQFFVAAAALLALALGLAILLASGKAQRVAEHKILENLKAVPALWEGYVGSQAVARRGQLRSLAMEPGTKALLGEYGANPETFHDTALEFARGLGAGIVFLFDARGLLLARSDRGVGEEAGRDFSEVSWVATPLRDLSADSAFILDVRHTRSLYLLASAPVVQGAGREGRLNGVIAAAFPFDSQRVREVAEITDGEVALIANLASRDAPPDPQLLVATPPLDDGTLPKRLADPAAVEELLVRGDPLGPVEFRLGDVVYIATTRSIRSGGGEPIAALVVARSKQAEMAAFQEIRRSLALVGTGLLLISLPVSFLLARRLARPMRQLAEGAEEIGRGQLDVPLPRASGEVGALARAFSVMVSELKAKAELERMLGELQRRPGDATMRGSKPTSAAAGGGPSALDVGSIFASRYEVRSLLGEGGMGRVFRVRDLELDEEIALKALKAGQPASEGTDGAEILRQEIKLARLITHPNVVRVHDYGEADGQRYFTMEYVAGTTLRELLQRRTGLELVPALQIAKQICRGLAAVHKAGVIHGDLKPHNVMMMGNGVVKLMDFGVARARTALGQGGVSMAGTPLYMSPEQARGAELDERSDIYSAGVVMFELFTGRTPFADADMYEVMRMHLNDPPPRPRKLRPELPEALSQIILACLDKSRLHRPGSAADLERLLMRVHL